MSLFRALRIRRIRRLIAQVEHGEKLEARLRAAHKLKKVRDPCAIAPIAEAMKAGSGIRPIHLLGPLVLGGIRDRRAVDALIDILETRSFAQGLGNTAWALGELGDSRAIDPIVARVTQADETLKQLAGCEGDWEYSQYSGFSYFQRHARIAIKKIQGEHLDPRDQEEDLRCRSHNLA